MKMKFTLALAALALGLATAPAQGPTPIVVQAIVPGAPPAVPARAAAPVATDDSAFKILQEIKAANEALLAKQAATLQQLEEMEKTADQIRIYSKRG